MPASRYLRLFKLPQNRLLALLFVLTLTAVFSPRRQWRDLLLPVHFALDFFVLLLPGLALTTAYAARRALTSWQALIMIVAGSASFGYLIFWAFFANVALGKTLCLICLLASPWLLFVQLRKPHALPLLRPLAAPLGYAYCAGVCYLCLLFLFTDPFVGANLADFRFFGTMQPGDNIIPLIFASKIYGHEPLKPFCCGNWLSSDRPPLQAGLFLFERPLFHAGRVLFHYQILGTILQCLWICGVWVLLNALSFSIRRFRQVLGLLIFAGFLFFNGVYVWPKLLAAAFILFLLSILIRARTETRPLTYIETALGAACFGLALMAHPGSIFSLPALFLFFRPKWSQLHLRGAFSAIAIVAVLYVPWWAYQRFYDPPGDRLIKMHLAASHAIDGRSALQTIREQYSRTPWNVVTRDKWENLRTLIGPRPLDTFGFEAAFNSSDSPSRQPARETSRISQREYIWNALGILNLGWIPFAAFLLSRHKNVTMALPARLLATALFNLLLWCVVIFGPGQTFTIHSSYADILLLLVGLSAFLLRLPRWMAVGVLFFQLFNLLWIWVWFRPYASGMPWQTALQIPLLIVATFLLCALTIHFCRTILASE